MSKAVMHADDTGVVASLALKDRHGNAVVPETAPEWSLSADDIVSMIVADDGMSASFAPTGKAGTITVDVVVDADLGPGVSDLHATGDIEVLPANIATADISFADPT